MDKEQAEKLVEQIDALTPSCDWEHDIREHSSNLYWNWGGEGCTLEKVKLDGYFCISWPEGDVVEEVVIKKNGYYYSVDSYEGDDDLFGSRIHESQENCPMDEDVTFVLD